MDIRCILRPRAIVAEGALWSPQEGVLYWIDQMRPEIHRFDPRTGDDVLLPFDLPPQLGALTLRALGGLVLAASDGITMLDLAASTRTAFADPIAGTPRATFNDAKCDRQGRLWAGTTDRQETDKYGRFYRIDPDGDATLVSEGYICSNGPSFSPDGRVVYHTRSHDRAIYAYDVDPATGAFGNERLFATIEPYTGVPDGSTVDAEGYLWSTQWGGWRINRYSPDGRLDRVVAMPVKSPTSCAFGGPDFATLYVTSASADLVSGTWTYMDEAAFAENPDEGGLFALDVGVKGLPETPFAG